MNSTISAAPAWAHYRNFHLWMLIPFGISLLGFSYSYYFNLANATFHQHVHGIQGRAFGDLQEAASCELTQTMPRCIAIATHQRLP